MKKRFLSFFMILAAAAFLTGCSSKRIESQNEIKETSIAAMKEGNYAEAVSGFDEALSLAGGRVTPREVDICYYKAVAQYLGEDATGAITTLDNVISYDEKNADAYYLRGSIYLSEGDAINGIADMDKAVEVAPSDHERVIEVYNALNGAGEREAGLSVINDALSTLGDGKADLLWKSRYLLVLEQYDEALAALDTLEGAGDTERLLIQGEQMMAQEQYEAALSCFEQGISYFNTDDEKVDKEELSAETGRRLLSDRVAACEFMGEWSDALKYAREYIAIYPRDARMLKEIKFLATR